MMDKLSYKNNSDEIEKLNSQIDRLKKKKSEIKRTLDGKTKYEYRKQRTRRLVQTGALAEKYFQIENLSISEREELFKMFSAFIKGNKPNHLKK